MLMHIDLCPLRIYCLSAVVGSTVKSRRQRAKNFALDNQITFVGYRNEPDFFFVRKFFALFVDVGYSGFAMRLPIGFYPCYRLLLPKGNK